MLKERPPGFKEDRYEVNYQPYQHQKKRNSPGAPSTGGGFFPTAIPNSESSYSRHHRQQSSSVERSLDGNGGGLSGRQIEYCDEDEGCEDASDEDEEEEDGQIAVSGKLAIHLDTGETSRECCLVNNRQQPTEEAVSVASFRSQTKEDTYCYSDEKPLFVKKYKSGGATFQDQDLADGGGRSAAPPIPPPRSKSKEGSFSGTGSGEPLRSSPRSGKLVASGKNDRSPADKSTYYDAPEGPMFVVETGSNAAATQPPQSIKQVHGKPFQGSLDENKNLEFSEKKEVKSDESEVSPSYSSDRGGATATAGKTSSSSKHLDPSRSRRKGVVSMPPTELKEYSSKSSKSDRSAAKRISLDDLSSAFQGVGGGGSAGDLKRQSSSRSRASQSPHPISSAHEYLSDESVPNGAGRHSSSRSAASGGHQRRSKSEESLLDWVDHVRTGKDYFHHNNL